LQQAAAAGTLQKTFADFAFAYEELELSNINLYFICDLLAFLRLPKTQRREINIIDIVYNIHQYINYVISVL